MRVTRGNVNRNKHKKVLKLTKGFKGGRGTIFRAAMQGMMRALKRAYKDRRIKKRDFRGLWIQRINAAAKAEGFSYSQLINGLTKAGIDLNRKMIAEIAVNDSNAFAEIVKVAKAAI
jgi:large subunit ribosomal protein L20